MEALIEWVKELDLRVSRAELDLEKVSLRKKKKVPTKEETEKDLNDDGFNDLRELGINV